MQRWIEREVQVRCHATRLAVPCDRTRQHSAFIPCQQEVLIDHLFRLLNDVCFRAHALR